MKLGTWVVVAAVVEEGGEVVFVIDAVFRADGVIDVRGG